MEVLRHVLGFVVPAEIKNQSGLIKIVQSAVRSTLPMPMAESWRLVGGALACALAARHCWRWRKTGVFGLRKKKEAEVLQPMGAW
jgi:hypothetical protein